MRTKHEPVRSCWCASSRRFDLLEHFTVGHAERVQTFDCFPQPQIDEKI